MAFFHKYKKADICQVIFFCKMGRIYLTKSCTTYVSIKYNNSRRTYVIIIIIIIKQENDYSDVRQL